MQGAKKADGGLGQDRAGLDGFLARLDGEQSDPSGT